MKGKILNPIRQNTNEQYKRKQNMIIEAEILNKATDELIKIFRDN